MNEVIRVPFAENEITVVEANGRKYVALKPLVEALGLNWVAQYELIHRDPVGISLTGTDKWRHAIHGGATN